MERKPSIGHGASTGNVEIYQFGRIDGTYRVGGMPCHKALFPLDGRGNSKKGIAEGVRRLRLQMRQSHCAIDTRTGDYVANSASF